MSSSPRGGAETGSRAFGSAFDAVFKARIQEADEFYATVIPPSLSPDAARVMRQALAGMLWSKQFFFYDVGRWLKQHGIQPYTTSPASIRNGHWGHMVNADVISMPDKWEYPWYAAWDLAFHVTALTLVDEDFGKEQLELLLKPRYLHPNGQMPAYEWNFSDVNPPVHAWSTIFTFLAEKGRHGKGDLAWLERCFHKLLLNFTWWVNRKDRTGNNVFEGGFLGLDNIAVFDRSAPLPTGGYLEQADGTAWMVLFCQNMIEIGAELALDNPAYLDLTIEFLGALPPHRLGNGPAGRRRRDVGRGGRLLLRRPPLPGRAVPTPEGQVDGRRCCRSARSPCSRGRSNRNTRNSCHACASIFDARPELKAFIHDPGSAGTRAAFSHRC